MSGFRVYQADPVAFDLDMNRTHSFEQVYQYVGASMNLNIECDWVGALDGAAANDKREPEDYRLALKPLYNDDPALASGSAVNVSSRWGTILDSLIHGVMQLISVNKNPETLLEARYAGSDADFSAAAQALNTVQTTLTLDFAKIQSSLAYTADVWVNAADKDNANLLKCTTATTLNAAPAGGDAAGAGIEQSADANKTNLGMLINNTNVKQVLNKMAIDGCFGMTVEVDNVGGAMKHRAPATITSCNNLVRQNAAMTDQQNDQKILDKNDKLIFPCNLVTLWYSTDGHAAYAGDDQDNTPDFDAATDSTTDVDKDQATTQDGTNGTSGMYQLAIANQITYDVNIVLQQSVTTDLLEGHDGMVKVEVKSGGDANATAGGDGPAGDIAPIA